MSNAEIQAAINKWKDAKFRPTDIALHRAVQSLSSATPLVRAKKGLSDSRWILYRYDASKLPGEEFGKVATFSYALVWQWGSDLETGNFVPESKKPPPGLSVDRVRRNPSNFCEISYVFDTSVDESLHDHILALEKHVQSQPEFNKYDRSRRAWQNSSLPESRQKYTMNAKIFARHLPLLDVTNVEPTVPPCYLYPIHPWIQSTLAQTQNSVFIANPDRPRYFDYTPERGVEALESDVPQFFRGDIILASFRVGFVVGGTAWSSELIPIEFIRVGKLGDLLNDAVLWPTDSTFVPLMTGASLIIADQAEVGDKRKADDEDMEYLFGDFSLPDEWELPGPPKRHHPGTDTRRLGDNEFVQGSSRQISNNVESTYVFVDSREAEAGAAAETTTAVEPEPNSANTADKENVPLREMMSTRRSLRSRQKGKGRQL